MVEEASLGIWAALGSDWPGALGWGNGEVWERYRVSGSTLKHQSSLGRRGVPGWEAATAEKSLRADSPRAISSGSVLGTRSLLLYHLGVNVCPAMAPFFPSSLTLFHKESRLVSG